MTTTIVKLPLGQKCRTCRKVIRNGWVYENGKFRCVACREAESRKRIQARYGYLGINVNEKGKRFKGEEA